jgi:hypothetical protein
MDEVLRRWPEHAQDKATMQLHEIHQRSLRTSTALTALYKERYVSPLEVIAVLNAAKVSFVLVGAHGIAGWMREPRATQDVDVVVAERHLKKATRALREAFPHLVPLDLEAVIRLCDRETGEPAIDLLKTRSIYRESFKYTVAVAAKGQPYRIPSLEMALAMKFAAMVSPNRQDEDKHQDAHDFIRIVKENPEIDAEKLTHLGEHVYGGGGADLVEMVRKVRAGEKLVL